MGDDDFIYWQDVLDEIAAGRRAQLRCPFCQTAGLAITEKGPGTTTRIECASCRHFIEGRFPIDPTAGGGPTSSGPIKGGGG